MGRLGELWRQIAFFFQRGRYQRDLEEEMAEHVRMKAEAFERGGMPPGEARHAAKREFGNSLLLRERSSDAWGFQWLETLLQDLRYGLRQLRRNPGFTAVAVITLALGIGANAAIFSVVDAVVLRPSLPYANPDTLLSVFQTMQVHGRTSRTALSNFSPANYLDMEAQNKVFAGMAARRLSEANVTGGDQPTRVWDVITTPSLFSVLGTKPLMGRGLGPADAGNRGSVAVVLSNGLWKEAFGGRLDVIGKKIEVNGLKCVVVGVMPDDFYDLGLWRGSYIVWQPMVFTSKGRADRKNRNLRVLARLKAGVSLAKAKAEMGTIAGQLQKAFPQADKEMGFRAWQINKPPGLLEALVPLFGPLYAAALLVLLVGCVNLSNLLLTRGAAREHEIAVRSALGAGRRRLVSQFLTEGVLLSLLGGGAGIVVAYWLIGIFKAKVAPQELPGIWNAHLDLRVFLFAFGVAVIAGVLFSIIPAWRTSRVHPHESLKQGCRSASAAAGARRFRSSLLTAETALSLVLLFGAGIVLHAFMELMNTDPGFDPHHVLVFDIGLDHAHYPDSKMWPLFFEKVTDSLKSIPGVMSAAGAESVPAFDDTLTSPVIVRLPGTPPPQNPFESIAAYNRVIPGYLQTLRVPLERGRYFTQADTASGPLVAIVSESVESHYFNNQNLLGKVIEATTLGKSHWTKSLTVVGVVRNVRQWSLSYPGRPMIYVPQRQDPGPQMTLVVRTGPSPKSLIPVVRDRVARVASTQQPVWDMGTIEDQYVRRASFQHTYASFFGGFALVTLLLAAVGIYGVAAYGVGRRSHEIGVRMALGATRGQILKMVVKQSLVWVLVGAAIGGALLVPVDRLLVVTLGRMSGPEQANALGLHASLSLVLIIGFAIVILFAVALIASLVPARRAAKVDPMVALRYE